MTEANIEDLVSQLMVYVSSETRNYPRSKKFAVERYMRTFLRSLTIIELEMAIGFYQVNLFLDPDITYKIEQASDGYDRYMTSRASRKYYPE